MFRHMAPSLAAACRFRVELCPLREYSGADHGIRGLEARAQRSLVDATSDVFERFERTGGRSAGLLTPSSLAVQVGQRQRRPPLERPRTKLTSARLDPAKQRQRGFEALRGGEPLALHE